MAVLCDLCSWEASICSLHTGQACWSIFVVFVMRPAYIYDENQKFNIMNKHCSTLTILISLVVLFIFLIQNGNCQAENKANPECGVYEQFITMKEETFSAKELEQDLSYLFSKLKEYHPQPYAFVSEDSLNTLFTSLIDKIDNELTLENFYVLAARLTGAVNCSHTCVRFPQNYQRSVNTFGRFFPLRLYFTDGRAYCISGNESIAPLQPGSEIISINDFTVNEIISQIFYLIPSEGGGVSARYNELNQNFNSLFYHIDDSEEFKVVFRSGTSIASLKLASCRHQDIDVSQSPTKETGSVTFRRLANDTLGLLKISSFAIRDMESYFQQLDDIFSELKIQNTPNLAIDLRDNKGGHPIFAAQLLSYLIDHDFIYFKHNEDIKDFEPLYHPMSPNINKFDGNVYVFVNGGCLSTTGHLISLLKFHTDAVFIGKEPGSTFQCNDFSIRLTLPGTGIELNVPRTTFESSVSGFSKNKPFPIDHKVDFTIAEIINRKDTYLEIAQKIIKY